MQYIIDYINAKGGALGKKFELVPFDNKSQPSDALIALKSATDQNMPFRSDAVHHRLHQRQGRRARQEIRTGSVRQQVAAVRRADRAEERDRPEHALQIGCSTSSITSTPRAARSARNSNWFRSTTSRSRPTR